MTRFVIIKLFRAFITLLLVVTFVFVVLRAAGDPAAALLDDDTPPDIVEYYRHLWGLDRPLHEQYYKYIVSVLHGNFGESFQDSRGVIPLIVEKIPATLQLGISAYALAIILGVSLGMVAALRRNTIIDRAAMTVAVFGYSMPNFFFGILLILIFGVWLRVLPSSGSSTLSHMILPLITLTTAHAASIARFSRSAMLEVLNEPYMRTARAKGLSNLRRNISHAFPNALIPIVTILGLKLGHLIGGAIVIETVFAWPGVGRLLISSVSVRDLAVVQALVLMIAASMVGMNLFVDFLYGLIDPRVRLSRRNRSGT